MLSSPPLLLPLSFFPTIVSSTCKLGCSGLSFCTNYNNRPTDLFRHCTAASDYIAKDTFYAWASSSMIVHPLVSFRVKPVTTCHPEIWKASPSAAVCVLLCVLCVCCMCVCVCVCVCVVHIAHVCVCCVMYMHVCVCVCVILVVPLCRPWLASCRCNHAVPPLMQSSCAGELCGHTLHMCVCVCVHVCVCIYMC